MFPRYLVNFPKDVNNFVLEKLLNISSLGVLILDENLKIIYWNKGAEKITGFSLKDVFNKSFKDFSIIEIYSKKKEINFKNLINQLITEKQNSVNVVYIRHKENYRFPIELNFFYFYDEKKERNIILGIFSILDMVIYTKKLIKSLKEKANKDFLTLLPNRRFLEYIINKKMREFKRFSANFGIILFDINNFKSINDCFGHKAGDKILKIFSNTIKINLRDCDILGRWGGDEFIAIILNVDMEQLKMVSDKLVDIVSKKLFKEKEHKFHIFVSAGYALNHKEDSIETLIERADKSMYKEKFKKIHP